MSDPTEPRDDSDRLAPCPFCGSEAEGLTMDAAQDDVNAGAMFVQCTNSHCMASSALIYPLGDDPKPLLLERWNRRASQSDGTSSVPDGWKRVPVEPTLEMVAAMAKAWQLAVDASDPNECAAEWRAACKAAPSAAQPGASEGGDRG